MKRVARVRDERGFSLVEVLVAVVIVGITFTVFVGGMGAAVVGSDHHRKVAVVQAGIRDFAEAVKTARFDTNCGTAATTYANAYSPPPPTRPSGAALATDTTTHRAPSLDAAAGDKLLTFFASNTGATFSTPTGMEPGWSLVSGGNPVGGAMRDVTVAEGPTGTKIATSSSATNGAAQSVLLRGASITRRGVTQFAAPGTTGTLSLGKPPGTVAGDTMVAQVVVRGALTEVAPPVGWTLIEEQSDNSSFVSLLYEKTATGVASPTFVWTFGTNTEAVGGIAAYGGVRRAYTATVTGVKYWDGNAFTTTCPSASEQALQLVSLRLVSNDNRSVQTVDVVKRCNAKPSATSTCGDA